jgi:hypothetical protein
MSNSGAPVKRRVHRWMIVGWALCIAVGGVALVRFDLRAGASTTPPAIWPAESQLPRSSEGATLVLFAHPRCPCTRSSLVELNRILVQAETKVEASIVFIQPVGMNDEWVRGALWNAAGAIPGAICVADVGLREATFFGAVTSGHVLFYDVGGRLLYSGGITIARGHEGANPGASAIADLLAARPAPSRGAPVFGCPLFNSESTCCFGEESCPSP